MLVVMIRGAFLVFRNISSAVLPAGGKPSGIHGAGAHPNDPRGTKKGMLFLILNTPGLWYDQGVF